MKASFQETETRKSSRNRRCSSFNPSIFPQQDQLRHKIWRSRQNHFVCYDKNNDFEVSLHHVSFINLPDDFKLWFKPTNTHKRSLIMLPSEEEVRLNIWTWNELMHWSSSKIIITKTELKCCVQLAAQAVIGCRQTSGWCWLSELLRCCPLLFSLQLHNRNRNFTQHMYEHRPNACFLIRVLIFIISGVNGSIPRSSCPCVKLKFLPSSKRKHFRMAYCSQPPVLRQTDADSVTWGQSKESFPRHSKM